MKAAILIFFLSLNAVFAGEAGVTFVYQVSDGLSSGAPQFTRIYCHDHYAQSGIPPFPLISAPNFPPSNSPNAREDHNLLSASKITVTVSSEVPFTVTIDATKASIPKRFDIKLPALINLASKAIAETAKEWGIRDYKIVVVAPRAGLSDSESKD